MKVYIEHSSDEYEEMFINNGHEIAHSPEEAELICFTGGADVSPVYYHEARHPQAYNDAWRDRKEADLYRAFVGKVPMVGICRGGQFLNVMNGGKMFQHVSNHTRSHSLTDIATGETIYVSSTHHQMMRPHTRAKVVAFSNNGGWREWMDEYGIVKREESSTDYEVVLYEDTKCLCFQPHPEFNQVEYYGMTQYFFKLIKENLI